MPICIFDLETTEWQKEKTIRVREKLQAQKLELTLATAGVFDENSCLEFKILYSIPEILNYFTEISKKYGVKRFYAHNLDFDIMFLLNSLYEQFDKLIPINNGKLLSLKCYRLSRKKDGGVRTYKAKDGTRRRKYDLIFEFRNSLSVIPFSVKKIGQIVGKPKLEVDYAVVDEKLAEYCYRDIEIVWLGLKSIVRMFTDLGLAELNLDNLRLTLPALAMQLFKLKNRRFEFTDNKGRVKNRLFSVPRWINEYFRENYYYGGRTEVFNLSIIKHAWYLDINSLYPYAMQKYNFPAPPYSVVEYSDENTQYTPDNPLFLGMECLIDESAELFPLTAVKFRDKTVFPAFRNKKVFITKYEYSYLQTRPVKITPLRLWFCAEWVQPFDYFNEIYRKRNELKKRNNPIQKLYKLAPNSTYGKFCENPVKKNTQYYPLSKLREMIDNRQILDKDLEIFDEINLFSLSTEHSAFIEHLNSLFGIFTTNLARLELTKQLHVCQAHEIPVYYCDTDSIVVKPDKRIRTLFDLSDKLGAWKIEHDMRNFMALAPKAYIYYDWKEIKSKSKGIGKSENNLIRYYKKGADILRPAKMSESIRRNIEFGSAVLVHKDVHSYYDKRVILSNFSTVPISDESNEYIRQNQQIILRQIDAYEDLQTAEKNITVEAETDIWNEILCSSLSDKVKYMLTKRLRKDRFPKGPVQKLITEFL